MEDYLLPFYPSPSSLEKFACRKISILLVLNRIRGVERYAETITVQWLRNEPLHFYNFLQVPDLICDMIKKSTREYYSRIQQWVRNHEIDIFDRYFEHDIIPRFIDFINYDDDKIIAKRILQSEILVPGEKYRLACKYCLANDIARLWPAVSNNIRITRVIFDTAPVLYYWNCVMMKVTVEDLDDSTDPFAFRVISKPELTDWFAVEYFWNKLNAEERLAIVDEILLRNRDKISTNVLILINLLPKLNTDELNNIQGEILGYVLAALASKVEYAEYVLQIWSYFCKHGDMYRLGLSLNRVFKMVFESEDFTCDEGRQVSHILYEFWIRARQEFRDAFIADYPVEDFFNLLNGGVGKLRKISVEEFHGHDTSFLLKLLEKEALPRRNEIWRKFWPKLVPYANCAYLEKFMKLCFNNEGEIIRFKEDVMMNLDESKFVVELAENGCFSQLANFIKFCTTNRQRIENLLGRIIPSLIKLISTPYLLRVNKDNLDKLIRNTFPNAVAAKKFKADYVLALLASKHKLLPALLEELDKGCLSFTIMMCDYLSRELCPDDIKCDFLQHCRECIVNCNFSEFKVSEWREFLTWCAGGEDNFQVFKQSIPVDEIFDKLVGRSIVRVANTRDFNRRENSFRTGSNGYRDDKLNMFLLVDNFLIWYFGSVKDVKDYKTARFNVERIAKIIESIDVKTEERIDLVLKWVFDYDLEKVNEYEKKLFKNSNISGLSKSARKRRMSKPVHFKDGKISRPLL